MFKNLTVYRIAPTWASTAEEVEHALAPYPFVECAPTATSSHGWIPPRNVANAPLVESIGGQWLIKLMSEVRKVPPRIVKRELEKKLVQIEADTGRKPRGKAKKEIAEEVTHTLLPKAFPSESTVKIWIDPKAHLLIIDTSSLSRAGDILTKLTECLPGFVAGPLVPAMAPATAMAHWLTTGDAPNNFTLDRETELKQPDSEKSTVKYARHSLDIEEVRQHIAAGKIPTQVAMTWKNRISFVLTDAMAVKKIALLDVVFEGSSDAEIQAEAFDTDAAIITGELAAMIPDLVEALGGENAGHGTVAGITTPVVDSRVNVTVEFSPSAAKASAPVPSSDPEPVTTGAAAELPARRASSFASLVK